LTAAADENQTYTPEISHREREGDEGAMMSTPGPATIVGMMI
jgi:hypothetical protein